MALGRNRTRATLVGCERCHNRAIPARLLPGCQSFLRELVRLEEIRTEKDV